MLTVRYGDGAEVTFSIKQDKVIADVKGKKKWRLGSREVDPLTGKFTFPIEKFISLIPAVWGIEQLSIESYEGVVLRVSYDWEGWKRGDDILKVAFIKYPEKASMFYLMRFYRVALSAFMIHLKGGIKTYAFKHWDVSFIRDEGELIIVKDGTELKRLSPIDICGLRSALENHLFSGLSFELENLDLNLYPKTARWTLTWKEHKQLLLKLYASVV